MGGEPPQADFAAAFEDLVNGEVTLEDEVASVFQLSQSVEAGEVHRTAFFLGELWSQQEGPVVESFADDGRAEPVGSGLQRGPVVDRQEGIVMLAEADVGAVQFLLDEGVAVEPIGSGKGEEGGHAQHDRSEYLVAEVEVVGVKRLRWCARMR